MSTPFQNRLVGTIIVAAVIVIFLPDILDGNKKSYKAQFEQIPAQDKSFSTNVTKTFPVEKLESLPKEVISDEQAVDDDNTSNTKTPRINVNNTATTAKTTVKNETTNESIEVTPVKKPASIEAKKSQSTKKELPEKTVAQEAWAIQLGSFLHKNNVDELTEKLKKAGYTVFTQPIKTSSGVLTKVLIGPELVKSKLDKQLPALKKLTNVDGKVARFYPTK